MLAVVERQDSFEALRESSLSFTMLAEYVPNCAVYLLDPHGRVATWNAGAQRMKQYTAEEITGRHFSCLYTAEDTAAGKPDAELARALAEGRVEDEGWRKRKDGTLFLAHVDILPIFNATGTLLGFGKITRDIGSDLSAEALRASESGFRLLIEGIVDYAVVMLDRSGNIQTWNTGSEHMFGFTAAQIVGQPLRRLAPPQADTSAAQTAELQQALALGKVDGEDWRIREDGTQFWASHATSPFFNKLGELQGFANITRDLTDRKQVETDLETAFAELTRSNQDLEQFAYIASHDLQEPLRAVSGCVQVLQKRYGGQLDARADELIAHSVAGVGRMQALIDDLLSYSRVGTRGKEFADCDCNLILAQALQNLETAIAETAAVLSFDQLPTVSGDAGQLTQVFQNLVSNAIKFRRRPAPKIHISAKRIGSDWLFTFKDDGIGIEPQYFDRIFVIFQRLHTRNEYAGTGLGLAICKKIVERHGGRIYVESEPGHGSTFCLTLPERGSKS